MEVYFPFPLSVHHVSEKLFIIQEAVFVFVIRINNILKEKQNTHTYTQKKNSWPSPAWTKLCACVCITLIFSFAERIPCLLISSWSSATDMKPSLSRSSLTNNARNISMPHEMMKSSICTKCLNMSCFISCSLSSVNCMDGDQTLLTCSSSHSLTHRRSSEGLQQQSSYHWVEQENHFLRAAAGGAVAEEEDAVAFAQPVAPGRKFIHNNHF